MLPILWWAKYLLAPSLFFLFSIVIFLSFDSFLCCPFTYFFSCFLCSITSFSLPTFYPFLYCPVWVFSLCIKEKDIKNVYPLFFIDIEGKVLRKREQYRNQVLPTIVLPSKPPNHQRWYLQRHIKPPKHCLFFIDRAIIKIGYFKF